MYTAKELIKHAQHINVLYVEDDLNLREEMRAWFKLFFKEIDTAEDGLEGLKKYNEKAFDIVITDINMPNMNGIEMVTQIKEINPEQKVIAISAHNESEILIQMIQAGVTSFILKPILQNNVIDILYSVCRDAYAQILNLELVDELNEKNEELDEKNKELQKQLKILQVQNNTIDIKHTQLESLLQEKFEKTKEKIILPNYFEKDEDEGEENVVFLHYDADDMLEYFHEIPERLSFAIIYASPKEIKNMSNIFSKISSILLRYSPFIDSLASVFNELSIALKEHSPEFLDILRQDSEGVLRLFDAVSFDMERYIERFRTESLAMKNAHHIHEPTMLSIRQIISLFIPDQVDSGEIEFF